MIDEALKENITLASQHYAYVELLFLTAQSVAFFSKSHCRQNGNTKLQSVSYGQVTYSALLYENISEAENVFYESIEFRRMYDFT